MVNTSLAESGKRVLILGVGNTLLGDEGFGVHAMRYLAENYSWPENVRLVDGGTLGLLLMAELMECDLAVILDIARGGEKPGTFYRIEESELGSAFSLRQSAHQTGIKDTLVSCELAGFKPGVMIFAMEPFDMATAQTELTEDAKALLPQFCARVASELASILSE